MTPFQWVFLLVVVRGCIDALLWGVGGYSCFRMLGGRDEGWLRGALITGLIGAVVQSFERVTLLAMGLATDEPRWMEQAGPFGSFVAMGMLVKGIAVVGGFKVAQTMLRRRFDGRSIG
jgi:hypothetical protein